MTIFLPLIDAVTLSRSTSFSREEDYDDDFSITTYDNFTTTGAGNQSSESEASSVLRADAISCNSFDDSSSSDSGSVRGCPGDVQVFEPKSTSAQPIYSTSIHIREPGHNAHHQSEA